ncbi:HAD-IB family hydrolase [Brenneria populi subsp. brevivirga]|uniref:HAD family hydrolase n=1 Tax=Brenneria populi TaxID=1505588 RepID=UPI002E173BE5|nr:HAD-IB family hydrolase [Brenneria populi subsp. brevivirga]
MATAFYDVDETILKFNSMMSFFDFFTKEFDLNYLREEFYLLFSKMKKSKKSREELNEAYYSFFKGFKLEELEQAGNSWFNASIYDKDVFFKNVVDTILNHQRKNEKIVFVSGSMHPLLDPIADLLNVDAVLCTSLCIDDNGVITGKIEKPQIIGQGKREAMQGYAKRNNINLQECYSYGDDISDIPMLECVGSPVCVGNQVLLTQYAMEHSWKVLPL